MNVLTRALCVFALVVAAPRLTAAQGHAAGDWHGVLATPGGNLTVLVQIRQDRDGLLAGDLLSADAPTQKISLGALSATGTTLTFSVPSLGATYTAPWIDSTASWGGIFRQGTALPLVLHAGAAPAPRDVTGMDGTWRGVLQRDTVRLRLVLHVQTTATRGTEATLDSPDIGAFGLPVQDVLRTGNAIRSSIPAAEGIFVGAVDDARRMVRGDWTRAGLAPVQVSLTRDATTTGTNVRTQWPITPNGYHAEDVSFVNGAGHPAKLGATLTLPDGVGPFPAVVLLSGSGPEDRDETLFGHKPLRPAATLARVRVPVLALNGALDHQVPSADNLSAIRHALARNSDVTVRELPGLNHLFQTATTGAMGEYSGLPETFAPSAMDLITEWILARSRRK